MIRPHVSAHLARTVFLGIAFALLVLSLAPGPAWIRTASAQGSAPTTDDLDDRVDEAIAQGIAYIRERQRDDGTWVDPRSSSYVLGMTCLASLALLENGVDRDDPAIARALRAVLPRAARCDRTYEAALTILFLSRIQGGSTDRYDPLIDRLSARLQAGQFNGGWSYGIPVERGGFDLETDLRPDREERSERIEDRESDRLNLDFSRGRRYRQGGQIDNSNTQFALLGVWAANRVGSPADTSLAALDSHFRSTQNGDGGWGYHPRFGNAPAMTCAGLMGLAIASARPERSERLTSKALGRDLAADPAFQRALQRVGRDARDRINASAPIYYLWSLERVCVALGLRDLDGFDWYRAGATELLRRQLRNGSWPTQRWGVEADTCLALLFLRKANLAFELDRVLRLPRPEDERRTIAERPRDGARAVLINQARAVDNEITSGTEGDRATVTVRQVDDAEFPRITLDFEVKRPDGTPVLEAQRDDFRVTEDGQEVEIVDFQSPLSTTRRPTTVLLVLDRSRSMAQEDRIGGLKRAVRSFLEEIPEGSQVGVIAFGSEVITLTPITDAFDRIIREVDQLEPGGVTRFYDAVDEALATLASRRGRRAVLALTDGDDTASNRADLESVIAQATELGLPVYTLGLGSEDEIEVDALRSLAESTRGSYYPARQADQLRAIYTQIAANLKASFTLTYASNRPISDGTLRPVQVFYKGARDAGEAQYFQPGMVVAQPGWPLLFLIALAVLSALILAPNQFRTRDA